MPYRLHRRTFVKSLAALGVAGYTGAWRTPGWAATAPGTGLTELSGDTFELFIEQQQVTLGGEQRRALTINGGVPGPLLRWREGDTVTLRVHNRLDEPTSLHWHGIVLPANMDGVPGLSFHGIPPGGMYEYRFKVRQHGTYWYHSHSGFQEQIGVYGPLVIEPREATQPAIREQVMMLTDWTDQDPARIFARLKKEPGYYNQNQRTLGDFIHDAGQHGLGNTLRERWMWTRMRMDPTDLADVTGQAYTYLVNGRAPDDNFTALFAPGQPLRLRFINGSAMTYFDVRIPGLKMTVVAADGQPVQPVSVDEFRIAVAETLDVLVQPEAEGPYTVFAQAMDRSGYARATLGTRPGVAAPVPELDAPVVLGMADMGMGHGAMAGMEHGGHASMNMAQAEQPRHPPTEQGNPLVDMQAMAPTPRLSDPGIGLRDNGRRVLTYADLRSTFADPDGREPSRTLELHLTGHMDKFVWAFDGVKAGDAGPIRLTYGERVRIVLVNDTMMAHPIHLHGMWSDLEDEEGEFLVRKHTIDVPPGTRRSYRVSADALGRWAYHCHMLYHMEAGMFREVRVDE
ncbi:copper resistance system multicopper oxidase [Pseudomonas japonica]|uniref:copper resistance system multicopper oxidase n=1 Tax=Pseudomonas japonica TaxID=256466 RepID=UPI0015E367A8|nr:copper resistance system multicopper oxidase [Pseudomonas japonica]MBA1241654.1 copper resistance system multicopper oxidase [Pseudomonas japonica]